MMLWLQCPSGASGDMLLGALLDAGAPLDAVQSALDGLRTEPIRLRSETVERGGIGATAVRLDLHPAPLVRTWANVRDLLERAELPEPVRDRALDVFGRLARAEAVANRTSPEQVHFHEVGALDALADIVGVSAALAALDVQEVWCEGVAVGRGLTRSAHGVLPLPGPAVVALLQDVGAPVWAGEAMVELCTPTGAALLASAVTRWETPPAGRLTGSGYGAGARDLSEQPNVLRVLMLEALGPTEAAGTTTTQLVVEATVDDLDPRLWPGVLDRLLDAGAVDVWLTPVLMKKGRPGHVVTAVVEPATADPVRRVLFTETSTIGLRETATTVRSLPRRTVTVTVDGHQVRVKVAELNGELVNVQPEFADVAAAAAATGRAVKAVLAAAAAAAIAAG